MKIYILRHGETVGNVARIMDGSSDVQLTDLGREQARRAGEALRESPFTHFYSSPLSRAYQTMEIAMGRPISYTIEDRLVERDCGALLGLPYEAVDRPSYWHVDRNESVYPNSESIASVMSRVHAFLDELKATLPYDAVVLLAAHSGISKAVRVYFEGYPEDGDLLNWGLENAEFAVYEV